HLWSERYDRELADVFAIQDEIAHAIATALQVKLAAPSQYKPNLPAYEALLRGRDHRQKITPEAHARGPECFKQAIALEPDYAATRAELGLYRRLSVTNGGRTLTECAPLIRAEARRALELDPCESYSHVLLGAVAAAHDYVWK